MTDPRPGLISDAVHDAQSVVASIRLAITSVLEEEADEFKRSMLAGADADTRRLAATLWALPALLAARAEEGVTHVDLGEALRAAVAEAARRQVVVRLVTRTQVEVRSNAHLGPVLGAVLVVLAAGPLEVTVRSTPDRAIMYVTPGRASTPLVDQLATAVGAARVTGEKFGLAWPRAHPRSGTVCGPGRI